MSKLRNQLIEESLGRAMSVGAIIDYWLSRARCVRCRHLDPYHAVPKCVHPDCPMTERDVAEPAAYGCCHFSD
jgi:hypothetical protein